MATREITKQDRIRSIPVFNQLNKRTIDEIARITDVVTVPAGQVVYKEGCAGFSLGFILEGQARAEKNGMTLNRLYPNDLCGEISLVDRKPQIATVRATTEIKLLLVQSEYFAYLFQLAPALWKVIPFSLCRYIQGLCDILGLQNMTLEPGREGIGKELVSVL